MSRLASLKSIVLLLSRSWILRILISLSALIIILYFYVALPWINNNISVQYQLQTGHQLQHDKLKVNLSRCTLDLNNLKDTKGLWQAHAVHIDLACWRSLRERVFIVNDIRIEKLLLTAHQLDNQQWSFDDVVQHLAKVKAAKPPSTSSSKNAPVVINSLDIVDAAINTNVVAFNNNMPLAVAPISVAIKNIDLRKSAAAALSLNGMLNQTVPFSVNGNINPLSLAGDINTSASNIPFAWFNSAIKPFVALEILSGVIEVHNHITLAAGAPQTLISSGKLIDLKLRPTSMEQDAVKWKSFEWDAAEIKLSEKMAHIPLLTLTELDGQFIIAKDRTTNVQAMIKQPEQPSSLPAPGNAAIAETSVPWQFSIDKLQVNNAAVGFNDQSLTPSFTAIVQQFSGTITDIANDEHKTTEINLVGNVDGYAPVNLKGKAKLFIAQPQLEALFSFKQMDMGAFTPYSAEYAGWRIKKGLLSVDLDYHYDQGKIVGKNHVVIDHLEFGEKVRSTHVVDIPLRLGLALLTDENGLAVLDAEISGDPKNPAFNVREIIWRALRNTLKKILTSPFRLLSDLVSSKEDLGRIQFTPGESQLTDAAINKIKLLQAALLKRPGMRLSIRATYDKDTDIAALKEEQIKSALQKMGVEPAAILAKNDSWGRGVTALYTAKSLANATVSNDQKYQELVANEVVDTERLNRLARERAQAVKQYFVLQLGVASENLLLDSENRCDKTNQCSSSEVLFTLEE